jgi:hypothetical protein
VPKRELQARMIEVHLLSSGLRAAGVFLCAVRFACSLFASSSVRVQASRPTGGKEKNQNEHL